MEEEKYKIEAIQKIDQYIKNERHSQIDHAIASGMYAILATISTVYGIPGIGVAFGGLFATISIAQLVHGVSLNNHIVELEKIKNEIMTENLVNDEINERVK